MPENEMFDSAIRSAGGLSGVFEYSAGVGYFYLYNVEGNANQKIIGSIRILAETPNFEEQDVEIRWDASQYIVGLFIRGHIWAAFNVKTGAKYGGDYRVGYQTTVPADVAASFE